MPGEHELVARHQVSRHTVREALRLVTELGLIERRQGVGTVVRAKGSSETYVQSIRSPSELLQYPSDSRLKVLTSGMLRADRKLAQVLGCTTGTEWFRFRSLRLFKSTQLGQGHTDGDSCVVVTGVEPQAFVERDEALTGSPQFR